MSEPNCLLRAKAIARCYRSSILPNSFGNQDPKREGRVSFGPCLACTILCRISPTFNAIHCLSGSGPSTLSALHLEGSMPARLQSSCRLVYWPVSDVPEGHLGFPWTTCGLQGSIHLRSIRWLCHYNCGDSQLWLMTRSSFMRLLGQHGTHF